MRDDEIIEFISWQSEMNESDLIHAFRALKLIERIRFEFVAGEEDHVERIKAYVDCF